jgi:hypothetical protein
MRELTYTLLELQKEFRNTTCDFCSSYGKDNKSVNQIRSRVKVSDKYVGVNVVCEKCKEKFENDELPKCARCGRLQTTLDIDSGCRCIRRKENIEEKELPNLPHERENTFAFYERQIKGLQEELTSTEEALEIEREEVDKFHEMSERRGKEQKQELLDRIKSLEKKIRQLEEENKLLKERQHGQVAQIEVKEPKKWPWLKLRK